MGWNAQPTRQVILDEVRVPASASLGVEGQGFKIAMSALNGGRINIAACSLGGAQWALDRAVQYVHERFTFGEPLAEKQSVVFTLADMATELRAARALVRDAARALDEKAPDAAMQCAMAKRFATDAGFRIANEALQLHGGYGYLHEYGIEKVVRDLRVHQILEGTNEIMRVIIGRELLRGSAAMRDRIPGPRPHGPADGEEPGGGRARRRRLRRRSPPRSTPRARPASPSRTRGTDAAASAPTSSSRCSRAAAQVIDAYRGVDGADGLLAVAASGTLFIDSSTIAVDEARAAHALAEAAGHRIARRAGLGRRRRRRERHARLHGRRDRRGLRGGAAAARGDGPPGRALRRRRASARPPRSATT